MGDVVDGEAVWCEAGRVMSEAWTSLPLRFSAILLDIFLVMPNHVHGIIQIAAPIRLGAQQAAPLHNAPTLGNI
ncbi:MAG: transposase, partial [Terriglobia bacterium]